MIDQKQLADAVGQKERAEKVINQYYKEQQEIFDKRLKKNTKFKDDELVYSASLRCPCGAGLAYPKDCGANHYWDCSAILNGTADKKTQHTARLPFSMYSVDAESDEKGTTRKEK